MTDTTSLPPPSLDRHAEAIAEVSSMRDTILALRDEVGQLKADLNRAEDRVTLVLEERNKYRFEALTFRSKLIELATIQSNIGLLTTEANTVMMHVRELSAAGGPKEEPQIDTTTLEENLKKLNDITHGTPVSSV